MRPPGDGSLHGGWVVRLPTWLGDTVMAVPTVRALARATGGPLLLWGPPGHEEVLDAVGIRAPWLPYRRRPGLAGLSDVGDATRTVRAHRPAAALLLPNAFEPALITALAGVPRRIGYATDGRGFLLTEAVRRPWSPGLHDADRYAALLAAAGIPGPVEGDAALSPESEIVERARRILPGGHAYLGVVPGAANGAARLWKARAWGELLRAAAAGLEARPVLLGSAADRPHTDAVARAAGIECEDLTGTGLPDLVASLLRCRVVVSTDSGAAHLAAALGRPTVVVFGPTDPRRTGARGAAVRHVRADVFCSPCRFHDCPLDHRCMERLDAAPVLEAVEGLWGGVGDA